jgi:hypothetical protein
MQLVEVKSLGGVNFVRAAHVIAVQQVEQTKCLIVMVGGTIVNCAEPARDIAARIEAALAAGAG